MPEKTPNRKIATMHDINLRKLEFFPDANPLLEPGVVPLKSAQIRSSFTSRVLADANTGELVGTSIIHQIKEVDSENFVKIFVKGVIATHELSKSAMRVFHFILEIYEAEPLMKKGFNDYLYLAPTNNKIGGYEMPFSKQVWARGFKELLFKNFLAPKSPYIFWVNPSLFFKGNRSLMVTELRKISTKKITDKS